MSRPLLPLTLILSHLLIPGAVASFGKQTSTDQLPLVVLRGRVVCLDPQGREVNPLFDCKGDDARFSLKSKDGKQYLFVAGDPETSIFTDSRVRQRDLQITAKLHPESRLELIKVQSVREGKLYDLYYFCELCNIRAYGPGLCPCCRNELEFRETPP